MSTSDDHDQQAAAEIYHDVFDRVGDGWPKFLVMLKRAATMALVEDSSHYVGAVASILDLDVEEALEAIITMHETFVDARNQTSEPEAFLQAMLVAMRLAYIAAMDRLPTSPDLSP